MFVLKFVPSIYDDWLTYYGSQSELAKLAHREPKMDLLLLQNGLWEFACKFHVLINAKIQTCIKLIGNHAKKSCLG